MGLQGVSHYAVIDNLACRANHLYSYGRKGKDLFHQAQLVGSNLLFNDFYSRLAAECGHQLALGRGACALFYGRGQQGVTPQCIEWIVARGEQCTRTITTQGNARTTATRKVVGKTCRSKRNSGVVALKGYLIVGNGCFGP